VKPANLLVALRGRAPVGKLADFGLARELAAAAPAAPAGGAADGSACRARGGLSALHGTLPYMAPELLTAPHAAGEAADIYSFGMVMWELLARREPFAELPLHALLHQLASGPPPRPALPGDADWEADGAAPAPAAGWVPLIEACWAERPEDRPRAGELVAALEAMLASLRPAALAPAPAAPAGGAA
jgi:serine/threonine protein kinase